MVVEGYLTTSIFLTSSKLLSVFPILAFFSALAGFFSIPSLNVIADYSFRAAANLTITQASSFLILIFLVVKLATNQLRYYTKDLTILFLIILPVLSSYMVGENLYNLAFVQFCFFALVVFSNISFEFNEKIVDLSLNIFVGLNLFAAILYFWDPNFLIFPVKAFGSFRGFSFDRVELSFFLSCFFCYAILRKQFFTCIIIILLVMLTESRSGILSVFLVLLYYSSPQKRTVLILFLAVSIPIFFMFSSRADALLSLSERTQLAMLGLDARSDNIKNILFGAGTLYSNVNGLVPHNNIIQTYLNFGLVGLLSNTLFLLFLITRVSRQNFSLILVYLIFGLSHQDLEIFSYTVKNMVWMAFFFSLRGVKPERQVASINTLKFNYING